MARYRNLLSRDNSLASESASGLIRNYLSLNVTWQIAGGSFVVTDKRDERTTPSYYSLKITPSSTSAVQLYLPSVTIPEPTTPNPELIFHGLAYSTESLTVSSLLAVNGYSNPVANLETLQPSRFIGFRSNHINYREYEANPFTVHVQLTFTHHLGKPFYLTVPVLVDDNAFKANTFVRNARKFFPNFYLDMDDAAVNPDNPMMKLFDIMTAAADDTTALYAGFFDYELSEIAPGEDGSEEWSRSTLVDPDYADTAYLPWLAQFVGNPLNSSVQYLEPSTSTHPAAPTTVWNDYSTGDYGFSSLQERWSDFYDVQDDLYDLLNFVDGSNISGSSLTGVQVNYSSQSSIRGTGGTDMTAATIGPVGGPVFNAANLNLDSNTAVIKWKDPDTKERFHVACNFSFGSSGSMNFDFPHGASDFWAINDTATNFHPDHAKLWDAMMKVFDPSSAATIWDGASRQEEANFTVEVSSTGLGDFGVGNKALQMWFGDGDIDTDFVQWMDDHPDGGVFYIKNGFLGYWTKIYFSGRYHIGDPYGLTTNGETMLVFYNSISPQRDPFYWLDGETVFATCYSGTEIRFDDDNLNIGVMFGNAAEAEVFKRWQLNTKYFGTNAGSREAINNAVGLGLSGDKTVAISPNYNGVKWRIHIRTLSSETDVGDVHPITNSSPEIVALAELAKPAGFFITHQVVDKLFFTLNNVGIGRLDISVLGDELIDPSSGGSSTTEDMI